MNDPRVLGTIGFIFLILGIYNIYVLGLRRMREARARKQPIAWYKQINVLTGIEYILLSLVFLVSVYSKSGTIPPFLQGLIIPLYLVLLFASAIIAGFVIRQGINNARQIRNSSAPGAQHTKLDRTNGNLANGAPSQRVTNAQRQRERRRNAAAARRRRSGKA